MFNKSQFIKSFISSSAFKTLLSTLKHQKFVPFLSNPNLKSYQTLHTFPISRYSFSSSQNSPQSPLHEDLTILKDNLPQEELINMRRLLEKYNSTFQTHLLTPNEMQLISAILQKLSLAHKQAGNPEKAYQYLLERNSLFQKQGIKDTLDVAQNYHDMASILWTLGNWTEAQDYFNEADRICQSLPHNKEARDLMVQNWHYLAKMNMYQNSDKALEFYKAILEKANSIIKSVLAEIYQEMGSIYHSKGNIDKTVEYWEKGLEIAISQSGENSKAAYKILDDIASFLSFQDQYTRSEPYSLRCLKIALKIFPENSEEIGLAYLQLVSVYRGKQDFPKALDYYHSAVKVFENLPEEDALITLYNSYFQMGVLYKFLGNHQEAENFFLKADKTLLRFNREPNSSNVIVLSRWAKQLYKQKFVAESKAYYWKAINVLKSIDSSHKSQIILTYVELGIIAVDEGNLKEALELFKESERNLESDDSFNFRIVNLFLGSVYLQ